MASWKRQIEERIESLDARVFKNGPRRRVHMVGLPSSPGLSSQCKPHLDPSNHCPECRHAFHGQVKNREIPKQKSESLLLRMLDEFSYKDHAGPHWA